MLRSCFMVIVTFAIVATGTKTGLTDEPHPKSLVGLLTPDMRVGIHRFDGSAAFIISVYSEEQFAIARDSRNLTLDQLKEKYVAVKEQCEHTLEILSTTQHAETRKILESHKPEVRKDKAGGLLGTISHVGEDYVLVTLDGLQERRLVLASQFISQIDLDASGVHLTTYVNSRLVEPQ